MLFIAQMNNKMQNKQIRDDIFRACQAIEENCGPDAQKILKTKVPLYSSFF
jgi:hypothetical protein